MKKSILILTGVFFALTLILPACKNKSTKEDTKKEEKKKKEVDPKIENECKMMMEFNVKNGVEGEYSEFVDAFVVRSKGIIDMKMTFEGNILLDTTEADIEMDTIYVGEVNEESLELYSILRDSSSISGTMGSIDTIVSTFNYTDGSFNDLFEGIEVTITETKESFQNNKRILRQIATNWPTLWYGEESVEEVSVSILSADPQEFKITSYTLKSLSPQAVNLKIGVKVSEEFCVEMRE